MNKNTAKLPAEGEGTGRRARVACADCKAKKKRCTHQEGEARLEQSRGPERHESEENSSAVSEEDTKPPVPRRRGRPRREKKPAAAAPPAANTTTPAASRAASAASAPSAPGPASAPASASAAAEEMTHPEDNLEGSIILGMHTVMARELQKKMADAKAKWQLAQEAIDEGNAATAAVQATLDQWLETWKKGL